MSTKLIALTGLLTIVTACSKSHCDDLAVAAGTYVDDASVTGRVLSVDRPMGLVTITYQKAGKTVVERWRMPPTP